jgi:hypothetical protein
MDRDHELEELFAQKGDLFARQLAGQLESGEENQFSPRFDDAVREIIARESDRAAAAPATAPARSSWKRQLKAACLVLVCLAGLGLGAMRVEAFRIPLLELLVGSQEKGYTQVQFPSLEGNASFRGEIQDYLPTKAAAGYQLESVEEDDRFIHAVYASDDGERLFLSVTPNSGSSVMLDSHDSVVTQTEIGTRGAFIALRQQDSRLVVLMYDNDYAYTLTGYLTEDEAVDMMASISG